jgi:osmoprotectant transport system ATP-binding protein
MPIATLPRALAATDVTVRYGTVTALDEVSVAVVAGRSLALVGESGSGKTTLLRCFNRMLVPTSGIVRVGTDDISHTDPIALRRSIGYVPQDGGLLPHWTVHRNVGFVARLRDLPDRDPIIRDALALVGLPIEQFGSRHPHELSGGQRQRVAIARAIAVRPSVLLMDEPFGALDAIIRADLHETFLRIRRELAFTLVLVTHDLAEAALLCDAIAVMRNGRIEQHGTVAELLDRPDTPYVAQLFARARASLSALAP